MSELCTMYITGLGSWSRVKSLFWIKPTTTNFAILLPELHRIQVVISAASIPKVNIIFKNYISKIQIYCKADLYSKKLYPEPYPWPFIFHLLSDVYAL